jgi:hypothetical protein
VQERAEALAALVAIGEELAAGMYRQLPGLLCFPSAEVAYRLKGLCRSLHMPLQQLVPRMARDPRLAFLDPEVVEARCGQVAKACGLPLAATAHLLADHGDLLAARNSRLLRRCARAPAAAACAPPCCRCGVPHAASSQWRALRLTDAAWPPPPPPAAGWRSWPSASGARPP